MFGLAHRGRSLTTAAVRSEIWERSQVKFLCFFIALLVSSRSDARAEHSEEEEELGHPLVDHWVSGNLPTWGVAYGLPERRFFRFKSTGRAQGVVHQHKLRHVHVIV